MIPKINKQPEYPLKDKPYGTMINLHMPLCLGLETVLLPKFDADAWPEYIKKYHIKHLGSIPAYCEPMMDKLLGMELADLTTVAKKMSMC